MFQKVLIYSVVFIHFTFKFQCNVQISETNNYKLMSGNENKVVVKSKGTSVVSFTVRMTSIGRVDIKVTALSSLAYDSLIRTVNVEVSFQGF